MKFLFHPKRARATMAAIIKVTDKTTTNSGRIFMPWVSSSKKRSKPALAAGMGARFSRLLPLRVLLILEVPWKFYPYRQCFG